MQSTMKTARLAGQPADCSTEMPLASVNQSIEDNAVGLDLAVIILSYNTVDLLRDCLASLFGPARAVRYTVCVVDNASTDGSAEMVQESFPQAQLVINSANIGYSAGNNVGLRRFGFGADDLTGSFTEDAALHADTENGRERNDRGENGGLARPRYALLLNPDTLVPPGALEAMLAYMDAHPEIGAAGPRVRRPDGSLDRACRRSFPTPAISAYRMTGLSRLFPKSRRFNAYNLEYLPEDAVHPVDSVVGAFMMVRRETIEQVGLLDERFFMYGEDLDWAKRMKDAGWQIWYNGQVEITHVKEASSRQSSKARIDFYEAMWLFYQKHYRQSTARWLEALIVGGIVAAGSIDIGKHLWRYCRTSNARQMSTR